jgi:hypothetical protein
MDLEGCDIWNLLGGTEENHEIPVRVADHGTSI